MGATAFGGDARVGVGGEGAQLPGGTVPVDMGKTHVVGDGEE